ncbi:hypothetical protein Lqui_0883 [Legionella quinlivanii]|uniref:Uncharacterized protein n=1 Tax=Legionella quinlivanii TaxID=45073 RepID=A0A0W0Y4Y1_9GAMM|nr:hypothetical protein [Legionella quinlivanii]KTD52039.1 hypothetical protein Lqui_0883 [Legionella quinlivanii]SEF88364.1 hypothetical protein SAMN02746093_01346 [Legionella quinlivanii DSM 21216]STY12465.1 Uncharacterised protein [Legionella quinlivanii]
MSGYSYISSFFSQPAPQATSDKGKPAASNSEMLPGRFIKPEHAFSASSEADRKILTELTDKFKKRLEEYHSANVLGVTLLSATVGLYIFSYLFIPVFLSLFAGIGATYEFKSIGEREILYKQARADLIEAYEWAMGKDTGDHCNKMNCDEVRNLIFTLGNYVPSATIITWKNAEPRGTGLGAIAAAVSAVTSIFTTTAESDEQQKKLQNFLVYLAQDCHVNTLPYQFYGVNPKGVVKHAWEAIQPELQRRKDSAVSYATSVFTPS